MNGLSLRLTHVGLTICAASACVIHLDDGNTEAADETGDGDGDGDCGGDPQHECTLYEPSQAGGSLGGQWDSADDDVHVETINAPGDPGGGLIQVELVVEDTKIIPALEIRASGEAVGAIATSSGAGTTDERSTFIYFAAAPGQSYEISARQWHKTDAENYPADYDLTWNFVSLVDCFEQNDTPDAAKRIALDTPVEGYAHAGFTHNGMYVEEYDDWYEVELDEPAVLSAELLSPPGSELRTRITITDGGGKQLALEGGTGGGETYVAETETLDPGLYLIRFSVAIGQPMAISDGDAEPESWSTPYSLIVRAQG